MDHSSAPLLLEVSPSATRTSSNAKTTAPFWSSLWRLLLVIALATGAILTTVIASAPSAYAAAAAEAASFRIPKAFIFSLSMVCVIRIY